VSEPVRLVDVQVERQPTDRFALIVESKLTISSFTASSKLMSGS
jgi:hypothetical protein